MRTRLLQLIAVLAAVLFFSAPSAEAARITGYITVYNNTSATITFSLDGTEKGTIQPGRRSSWLVGDKEERNAAYILDAYGQAINGGAKRYSISEDLSNYTWYVTP